jgi:hypothetical protein
MWGSPNEVDEIIVNGRPFSIRRNLFLAFGAIRWHLRKFAEEEEEDHNSESCDPASDAEFAGAQHALRTKLLDAALSPEYWKYFWIDAICINQDDIPERNSQVQMMGDIYTNATFVMIWLGPGFDESLAYISTREIAELETNFSSNRVYKPLTSP